MNIQEINESEIDNETRAALITLLSQSFSYEPCFSERIYYKQLPQRRLILEVDGAIVAQMGLEHRVVGTQSGPASILGIIDLCVLQAYQGRGCASKLLARIENQAAEQKIDFIMLFASDARVYQRVGFSYQTNTLRWLAIDEHQTLGVAEEPVDELMIKIVGNKPWPEGTVDLLGYLF